MRSHQLSRNVIAAAFLALITAACAGNGSSTSTVPSVPQGNGPQDVISQQGSTITATGTITYVSDAKFTLLVSQHDGNVNVTTTSSTVITGAKPYVGEQVEVIGTGYTYTSIAATSVTQLGVNTITVSGPVTGMLSNGFSMYTGPHTGYVHVYTSSTTQYVGQHPFVGENVTVAGTGSTSTYINANIVTQQTGTATPTPAPTSTPVATPTPIATPTPVPTPVGSAPPPTNFMPSSWGKIQPFQIFDETSTHYIGPAQAQADGPRYVGVWGPYVGNAQNWRKNTSIIQAQYYMPLETDASTTAWGKQGQTLAWWQANHPDWVLYACDSNNNPTHVPAIIPGLTTNVPLDIHNPAVVDYQIRQVAAPFAHSQNYNSLSIDEATFWNPTLNGAGPGYYGCGIWEGSTFVRRYSNPNSDSNWNADIIAWVQAAHRILTSDPVVSQYHLKLVINHPPSNIATTQEQQIVTSADAILDETGFSDYGNYLRSSGLFRETLDWMIYAQKHGTAILMNDEWNAESNLTPQQADYSIATYLMGNEQGTALFAAPAGGYGGEWYRQSEYTRSYGAPCGEFSGGSGNMPYTYYRRYQNAFVVVNGSTTSSETISLPSGHTFTELEGRSFSNPLTIAPGDGYVLLTSNGCN